MIASQSVEASLINGWKLYAEVENDGCLHIVAGNNKSKDIMQIAVPEQTDDLFATRLTTPELLEAGIDNDSTRRSRRTSKR